MAHREYLRLYTNNYYGLNLSFTILTSEILSNESYIAKNKKVKEYD